MLLSTTVAERPEFRVSAVTCRDEHVGWSAMKEVDGYRLVLVRRGRFRREVRGRIADHDASVAYIGARGEEERFAHPHGGDVCTSIGLSRSLWHASAGDVRHLDRSTFYIDARTDLVHRRVTAAAKGGDVDYALVEELLELLSGAIEQAAGRSTPAQAPTRGESALVAAAREAIAADHPEAGGLLPLARLLQVSPFRLSRAFPRELGVPLTRYRNRIRVGRALDRIEHGETHLGILAADLGFADQAHLTRTIRQHLGRTPSGLRRLLSEREQAESRTPNGP